jgi:hypothetical protein
MGELFLAAKLSQEIQRHLRANDLDRGERILRDWLTRPLERAAIYLMLGNVLRTGRIDESKVYYHQAIAFTWEVPGSDAGLFRTTRERLAGIELRRREVSTVPWPKSSNSRQD